MTDQNEFMGEAELLETIDNQLADGQPKKVTETLMRLMMTGSSKEDAKAMMACALTIEIFDVMKNDGKFDEKRYAQHLDMLPDLSFMQGE
ncbi:hypothetical protein L3V77_06535 [Vibrio sp. DW001]|uniref:hypothetical protein n=1 Tax=unclassified Vibrio TaxID=2614977 RepID=UPI0023AE7344|nr:hypothetical protein [Vibrio sp. DW001]WED27889.1 hypothetical protein L3V77_06535 [Vibrio sp. DW001]